MFYCLRILNQLSDFPSFRTRHGAHALRHTKPEAVETMKAHTAEDALWMSLYSMVTFRTMKANSTEDANQMSVSLMAYTLKP